MLKKILIIAILTIVGFVALFAFLHWQTGLVTELSAEILNVVLNDVGQVEYRSLNGNLLNEVEITGLKFQLSGGLRFSSNRVVIDYGFFGTITGDLQFSSIIFDSLTVVIPAAVTDTTGKIKETRDVKTALDHLASTSPVNAILEKLPKLVIDRLRVQHGQLIFGKDIRRFDEIQIDLNLRSEKGNFILNIEKLCGSEAKTGFYLVQSRAQVLGNTGRITLNRLEIETPGSHLFAQAELTLDDSAWIILGLQDSKISALDINALLQSSVIDSGLVHLTCDVVGHPNHFSVRLAGNASVNMHKMDSLYFDLDYNQGNIQLRKAYLKKNAADLTVIGKVQPNGNSLKAVFHHINLADFDRDYITSDLSGHVNFITESLNDPFQSGQGVIILDKSVADTIAFDSLRIALKAKDHHISIDPPSYFKIADNSIFQFRGYLDKNKNIDFQVSTEQNEMQIVTSLLGLGPIEGTFDGNFFLTGKLMDPDLEGYLWVPVAQTKDFHLESLILQLSIKNVLSSRQGTGIITADNWRLDSLAFNETMMDFVFDSNKVVMDTLIFANGKNYISSSGMMEVRYDTVDVTFDFFRINYQNSWMENMGPLILRLLPHEFVIENARFTESNKGELEVRGFWDRVNDEMQFGVYLSNIGFTPFTQFMNEKYIISGIVDADFELINPFRQLEIEMDIHGKDLALNKVLLGDVRCEFKFADDKLHINTFKMLNGETILDLAGNISLTMADGEDKKKVSVIDQGLADLQIYWKNINLGLYAPLFALPQRLSGKASGRMTLTGTVNQPVGQVWITGSRINYDKFSVDTLNLQSHFDRDYLTLDQVDLGLNETSLSATGRQKLNLDFAHLESVVKDMPFELQIQSRDNKITFLGLFLDQVERIEGSYEAALTIAGTHKKPALVDGYFRMTDGTLTLSRVRNPIKELNIDASVENSVLMLNSFSGYAEKEKDFWESAYGSVKRFFRFLRGETKKEGELTGYGEILLSDLNHPQINLSLDAYRFYIDYFIENTNFVLSTDNLNISGRDTLNVSGSLVIDEGTYIVDLSNLRKNIYLRSTSQSESRPLTWNLELSMPGNFNISSSKLDLLNNFDFEIMGDLRMIQEANAPTMDLTGYLEIISGKYGSWGQNFEIELGTINFTDPRVINPDINILAKKKAGEYFVEIGLTGDLENLKQTLRVKDQSGNYLNNLSDQEVLGLLTVGSLDFNVAGAGGKVISTSVETAIERGAEVLTGLDKVNVASAESGNMLDFESVSLGKYLTSNLYVEYTMMLGVNSVPTPSMNWRSGNQIGIEYRINKNWSVGSHYLRTDKGNNVYRVALGWKTSF